jgi:4-hydroxy-4-methyl-2-oxoglutarate aldolase
MMTDLSSTILADVLDRRQVMDAGIRSLWSPAPRIAGPAFTVRCPAGDNLMVHAAIYRAEPGSVIVVESGDLDYALAGGNVCAVAQRNGIAGFVLDGLIRDIGEVRAIEFPVFARGVIPIPGGKAAALPLNVPIRCGGVPVRAGDLVVADEDGIVVVPSESRDEVIAAAAEKESPQTLDEWERAHRSRIDELLRVHGHDAPAPDDEDPSEWQGNRS